jgi:predicted transcriptional regulator
VLIALRAVQESFFRLPIEETMHVCNRFTQLRHGGDDRDDNIHAVLKHCPGAVAKEIAAATGIGIFSVRYRLLTLEAAGAVRSEKKRNRLHYYNVER